MKVIKILGWAVLALVIVVAVAVYFTLSNLNDIVKRAVEQVGSDTLQTEVTLASADVNLREASVRLSGLTIHNPSGFDKPTLFELDDIQAGINLQALADQTVDLKLVTIDGMRVVAEQKGTTTNIQQLLNNLPAGDAPAEPEAPDPGQSGTPDVLIRVGKFQFTNSSATLVTEKWGEQQLSLPGINLANIGGTEGVPPNQFASAVFKPLLKQINRAVEDGIKDAVEEKAREKLEEKEEELKGKAREKLNEELGEDTDDAESAIKSLLNR